VDVDRFGRDGQPVPGGRELDEAVGRAAVPQPPPEPRDLGLQRLGGALGRVLAVQAVDQPPGADDAPGVEGEQREQPAQLRTTEGDRGPVGTAGFDRPEDGELHVPILARRRAPAVGFRGTGRRWGPVSATRV
jgi:hypothetical protein